MSASVNQAAAGVAAIFENAGVPTDNVQATLTTALTGTNNDMDFTSLLDGSSGNSITIAYIDPAGNNKALSVVVTAYAIVVNLATGVAGAITSTAAQIKTALDASAAAAALISSANHSGNDGTGVVTALVATALASGVDGTGRGSTKKGALLIDTTNGTLYQNTGTQARPAWTSR